VQANDQRLRDAKLHLQSVPIVERSAATGEDSFVDLGQYDLVIVVITTSRARTLADEDRKRTFNLGYLTQTVARLLKIVRTDSTAAFQHKKLVVCSVDLQPQRFTEALELSKYVQVVSMYQNNSVNWQQVAGNMFEKEKDDYVYCLKTASSFVSPYYLVVEDDVLLDERAIETVHFLMSYFGLFSAVDWLFVKLYYPEKWSGYSRSCETVVEVAGYSVLGGCLCVGIVLLTPRHRKCLLNCRNLPVFFWFVVGAVFTALVCTSIGRQYVESWRHYFVSTHQLVAAPGCCTQAVLYPAHIISDLSSHLRRVHSDYDYSIDIAIDGFAHVRGLRRYLVRPNVARHIGLISNLRRNSKTAEHFL